MTSFSYIYFQAGQIQASDAANISAQSAHLHFIDTHSNMPPSSSKVRPASRRDAATLTEAVDNGKSTGTWGLSHRRRRLWQIYRPNEPYSSEEEPITNKEEDFDFQYGRGEDTLIQDPKHKEEKITQEHRVDKYSFYLKLSFYFPEEEFGCIVSDFTCPVCFHGRVSQEMEASDVYGQNNNDRTWKSK